PPERLNSNNFTDVELISSPSMVFGPLFKKLNTMDIL
ncbi:MAG: hypothetical protein ACJAWK_001681, partial [Candidatus Azotimanducaceae bacterium]